MGHEEWQLRGHEAWIGNLSRQNPHSPGNDQTAEARKIELFCGLAGVERGSARGQHLPPDLAVVVQVGPTGRQLHDHPTCRLQNASPDLDQPRTPGARLAFAERIMFAAAIVPLTATAVSLQAALELLVAVFALAAIGVLIVGSCGQNECCRPVADHGPAIRAW